MSADTLDRLQRQLAPVSEDLVEALAAALEAIRGELARAKTVPGERAAGYRKAMSDALELLAPAERAHERWLRWAVKAAAELGVEGVELRTTQGAAGGESGDRPGENGSADGSGE